MDLRSFTTALKRASHDPHQAIAWECPALSALSLDAQCLLVAASRSGRITLGQREDGGLYPIADETSFHHPGQPMQDDRYTAALLELYRDRLVLVTHPIATSLPESQEVVPPTLHLTADAYRLARQLAQRDLYAAV
jgi:hypothetical protein